jgi:hypothetical protein
MTHLYSLVDTPAAADARVVDAGRVVAHHPLPGSQRR